MDQQINPSATSTDSPAGDWLDRVGYFAAAGERVRQVAASSPAAVSALAELEAIQSGRAHPDREAG